MSKQKAPPAPDYAAAAVAQGEANIAAANATAGLNRPNQIDRNGTQTWTMRPDADPKNPQAGDWIVTNKLSDTQERLAQQQDQISQQYGGLAQTALGGLKDTIGTKFDPNSVPGASALSNQGIKSFGNLPQTSAYELAPEVNKNRASLSNEGLQSFGKVDPTTEASRQRITDAMYARQTAMLDPRAKQQSSDLTSRLAAQGITEGSEAYNRAVDNQARQTADEYARARSDAILAGGAEDSRIGNQNLDVAQFANQTRGQQFDERGQMVDVDNANIDSVFGQGLARAGFNNDARNTQFQQGMDLYGAGAATRGQQFNELAQMNSSNNTLHGNALQEALQQRQLGLNEANALRTGAQTVAPTFQPYGGAGTVGAAPVFDAVQAQYNAQLGAVNAANATTGNTWNGLVQAGASAAAAY